MEADRDLEKTKRKTGSRILRLILLIICGAVLGLNIYHLNSANLVHDRLPMPFGYGSAVVLSGSMEPELSKGDLIIVKDNEDYGIGDVVVFQDADILVVHRIVDMDDGSVTTKGDANPVADQPVGRDTVKGVVTASVPHLGTLVNIIKSPFGTVLVIICAVLLLEVPRRREKQKADEERQKIIDEIRKIKDEIK